jgi:hypothetical protein
MPRRFRALPALIKRSLSTGMWINALETQQ